MTERHHELTRDPNHNQGIGRRPAFEAVDLSATCTDHTRRDERATGRRSRRHDVSVRERAEGAR